MPCLRPGPEAKPLRPAAAAPGEAEYPWPLPASASVVVAAAAAVPEAAAACAMEPCDVQLAFRSSAGAGAVSSAELRAEAADANREWSAPLGLLKAASLESCPDMVLAE